MKKNKSIIFAILSLIALITYAKQSKVLQIFRNGKIIQEYAVDDIDYIEINDLIPAPDNVNASVTNDQITIKWNPVEGATYNIYRSPDNVNFTLLASELTETTYTDTKPLRGSNFYRVKAVVGDVESGYTSSAVATLTSLMIKDAGEKEITIYATDDAAEYYVSVMKGGHNSGTESRAVLRVMTPDDFKAYKTRMYGNPEFPGLDFLNPDFYTITDANGNPIKGTSLTYNFSGADNDRYFGFKVLLNAQKISDWRAEMESTPEGIETLNNTNFVVPIGLYSSTDSVNADNQAVIIHPVVTNPVLQIEVENNAYHVTEISRTKLLNDSAFRKEHILPEVYLSIPCKNPYGFKVQFTTENGYVSDFNSSQSKVSLSNLRNLPNKLYEVGTPQKEDSTKFDKVIEFPAGVTKVRFPIEFFTENIDAEDLSHTWVRGFRFKKAKGGMKGYDMVWPETIPGTDQPIPDKVKYSLTFPTAEDGSAYTFFIGYKVVETTLELSDAIVTSNDCEPTEGSIAALFDNDLSTFFHSGWSVAFDRSAPFGSYLEIDCTGFDDINACCFLFTTRSMISRPVSPKEVHLYCSNEMDDETRRENKASWTLMAKEVLNRKLGTSQVGEIGSLANPIVTPDYKPFKFLRFCVVKNSEDQSLFASSTSIYWSLAELVMYGKFVEKPAETETPAAE